MMKKVDFLFEYEVRNRELDSLCLIGAYLELKGYIIGYVNSWDSLFNYHRAFDAEVMIISASYNDLTYDYFTSHANSFKKVVNMQWEQVLVNNIVYSKEPSSWDYKGIALSTRHICWGTENKNYLNKRYLIPDAYLNVCGYIPLDFYREEFLKMSIGRDELFNKYNLDPSKQTLLFVSSFSLIGLPKSEEAVGLAKKKVSDKQIQIESQKEIVKWFDIFLKSHPNYQIVYRPHPSEANNKFLIDKSKQNDGFFVIAQESIRNWILCCDILCNWKSTSMIEMFVSKKKTLLLRPIDIPFENEMPIFIDGKFKSIKSYIDFESEVTNVAQEYTFPIESKDLLRFYDIDDKPTYQRIGDYLISTLNDENYYSQNRNKKISFFRKIYRNGKMYFWTCLTRVAHKIFQLNRYKITDVNIYSLRNRINEQYVHYDYFLQKMRQNRSSKKEIRMKIEHYKSIISTFDL